MAFHRRRRREEDLEAEIQAHLAMAARDRIERGEPPEEAAHAVRREFGNVELVKEVTRDMWGWSSLDRLWQDLRFGCHMLHKSPGFAAVAMLTLALGIGFNTTIFSVVNTILIRPLPYEEADRLVRIFENHPKEGRRGVTPADFVDWHRQSQLFDGMAAIAGMRVNFTGKDYPEQILAMLVTSDLFGILRAKPAVGRLFRDDEYGSPFLWQSKGGFQQYTSIILSDSLWKRRFGGDPSLLGQTVSVDGRQVVVAGVMPADFRFDEVPGWGVAECWIPGNYLENEQPRMRQLTVIARMKPGVSMAQAQTEMDVITGRLRAKRAAENAGWSAWLQPLRESVVGNIQRELLVLFGAVGFVLLIACANLTNLLLARSTVRQRELAVRASLGAGRARLVRQLLTEMLLICLFSGITGFLLAIWGVKSLIAIAPTNLPRLDEVAVDIRVFTFALAISVLAGLASGVAPALRSSNTDLVSGLKDGSREISGTRGHWLNGSLVIVQIGLALMLLIGAGLMVRTFARLQSVKLGFNPDRLLTVGIGTSPRRFMRRPMDQLMSMQLELLERVRQIPGIEWAGSGGTPLSGSVGGTVYAKGQADGVECSMDAPSPEYFQALEARLLEGRFFNRFDTRDSAQVAIVNRALAQACWRGEAPLGKKLGLEPNDQSITVVGVVDDVRMTNLERVVQPEVYFPLLQSRVLMAGNMVVRTKGDPLGYVDAIRKALGQVDPDTPLVRIATMEQLLWRSLAYRRFNMVLVILFSTLAFGIAALGIYGLVAYAVSTRIHELGIRLALGAEKGQILFLVFREGVFLVIAGEIVGLVGALALNRVLSSMVFGIKTNDASTYAIVMAVSAALALFASYLPSRRVTSIDPIIALRCE